MSTPIWTPSPSRIGQTNMTRFLDYVKKNYEPGAIDYPSLYGWSIRHPESFWPAVWEFCGIRASRLWDSVLEDGDKMPGTRWFTGSMLNFAENLLRRRDDKQALVFWGEDKKKTTLSYAELWDRVAGLAYAMRDSGVTIGDRVAAFMPNMPETVIAMLATTSIGAIWSSCSPDFGINGVLDRFGQIKPKILFTADGYFYKGKAIDSLRRLEGILGELPDLQRVIVVPYVERNPDISAIEKSVLYADFARRDNLLEIDFEQCPFDHPIYILYSSGTTGKPKCIVHGAGGTLIQHLKELVLHTDLKPDDRVFYFTTCGWMMWNWLVSSLAVGATVLLYDGSPFDPSPAVLLDFAEQERITVFGTSAKYLSTIEKAQIKPRKTHALANLRAILSTGSPLSPESYDYVYRDIKADIQLSSISGGTDLISCFALGNPILPVFRGELQCRGLGMAVEVFDERGKPIRGVKGELVCTAPFPSMPVFFWEDPEGKKYRAAYFETHPDVWVHGDYAELTEHEGMIIYGRSDTVLNPGGVRIGTAEIYRQVEKLPEVLESIAVDQEWKNDKRIILFVKLRENIILGDELITKIKSTIRENTTPRHVPAKVIQVYDIPCTLNSKIVEIAVRNVIHGRHIDNVEALSNLEALEFFRDLPELKSN
ncbi:MAG: acetoacetate--CoA ligase [Deltaproteobacteria bacterium]|nr:acetoacetate--CoA ligase [Deltaproteobacteria bacterium]